MNGVVLDKDKLNQLTQSLSSWNPTASSWVNDITHALMFIDFAILGIMFLLEWAKTAQRFRETQGTPLTSEVMINLGLRYFIATIVIGLAPQIIDGMLYLANAIGHTIATTGGLHNQSNGSNAGLWDMSRVDLSWYQKGIFGVISFLNSIGTTIISMLVTVIVFMRFLTLCVYKILSPIMLAASLHEDYRSVSINYWKQVAIVLLQSVVLIIILKLIPAWQTDSQFPLTGKVSYGTWQAAAALALVKLFVVGWAVMGSQSMIRRLIGG
ncbi:hypothetical protein [Fructobacillus evanidus]|uniref:hypothetical protein n=1 Tax=Fructobacillus evanidus TaxID=3064281 RepID=UPI002D9649A1|nr:hypothetical protein R55250_KEHBDPNM_00642 [Fructobacillus sp. LMG 32999]CAK1231176.1 hypothetical protein R53534_HOPDCFKK_00353 [Fructobacillus sp. LMG 32999]CAK1232390.1 hypothetical protein R55234_GCHJJDIB_00363 [Fructobacillus sp. LMG 32999]CAK1240968.1 hypothetical protein R55203_MFJFHIJN_00822 [Fructobacillus sp. LMG 32999]